MLVLWPAAASFATINFSPVYAEEGGETETVTESAVAEANADTAPAANG